MADLAKTQRGLLSESGVGMGQVLREGPPERTSQAEIDQKYISHRCQLQAPAVDASHRAVPSIPKQTPGTSHPSTSADPAPIPQQHGPGNSERGGRPAEERRYEQKIQPV